MQSLRVVAKRFGATVSSNSFSRITSKAFYSNLHDNQEAHGKIRTRVSKNINLRAWGDENKAYEKSKLHPIYLDNQATTPMDPRVLDAMLPFYTEEYGNPHSRTHEYGWETDMGVEVAREQVASLIGADPKEIVFTSGATESNNAAIKGIAHFYKAKKNHIITTQIEHKCVLDSCRVLSEEGFKITYLPVDNDGVIDLELLDKSITPETALVSTLFLNNEIGTIQKVKEIGEICKRHKVFFHTDAAQAAGKVPIDVNEMNIDLMSISGHKIYGPMGIGALYVRRRPRVRLDPIISGGGQERGMRSGTLPAPLVVGLGAACEIAQREIEYDSAHVKKLSEHLLTRIKNEIPHVIRNGNNPAQSYPGCANLSFSFIEGESLLMALKGLALSSGSACTSASLEPSYVLRALGVKDDLAHSSLRLGIGRFTTIDEINYTVDLIKEQVERLRHLSPLYDMFLEGIDINSIQWSQH
ncbi:hypothetical protein BB561_002521 [Smittium simulii]|uniref:Cysteine desulfurase, mitosomal n=1 Tax=Smittium simulii TaxID=133385 RepID=A0A2T9YQ26_9FUNG|nr:hypothetical protein BB561_002521 [Smittium simulii]